MTQDRSKLLTWALGTNVAFSGLTALPLLGIPETLSPMMGDVPVWALRLVGAGLLGFIGLLLVAIRRARRPEPLADLALLIIVLDFGWVLGTLALTPVAWADFAPAGAALFWGVGAVVLAIAAAQWIGIDRLYAEADKSQGTTHRLAFSSVLDVPPKAVWPVLADLESIDQHLGSLANARLEGQPGVGAVRTCTNDGGQSWSEEVTGWVPGRSIDLSFLSDRPGFPFPMHPMRGGWILEPLGRGARLTVWWTFTPRPRALAPLLVTLLTVKAKSDMMNTMASMARAARAPKQPAEVTA